MKLSTFNFNETLVHEDAIILIYNHLEFGDLLKMRMLNKFNKSLIDENISTFYSNFRKNNTQLPKLDTYNIQLCDIIKTIISNYRIESIRQLEIANLPNYSIVKKSALKGFQHFKKTLKLRNIGFIEEISNIIADKVNCKQFNKVCELKKKGICDYACLDFATILDDYSIEKAIELIYVGFDWCYAMFAVQRFNDQQIQKMINLKESGFADSDAYYKIYNSIR